MGLAEDILEDLEESVHEDNEEVSYAPDPVHVPEPVARVPEPVATDNNNDNDKQEDGIDFKKIAVVIVITMVSYVVIIQYKLVDVFLESKLQNIPLVAKRFTLFSVVVSVSYIIISLNI
jgi:hypothetical protein